MCGSCSFNLTVKSAATQAPAVSVYVEEILKIGYKYKMPSMSKILKFRIWDNQTKHFIQNTASLHCESNWSIDAFSGGIINFVRSIDGDYGSEVYTADFNPNYYADGLDVVKENRYILSQCTGLKDRHGKEVHEGDLISFNYQSGTDDSQNSVEAPSSLQKSQIGKIFIGRVVRDSRTTNLTLEVLEPCGITHYPLVYAGGENAEIIGNVFEKSFLH